jgi:membrane-associated phospholipid phosphatase
MGDIQRLHRSQKVVKGPMQANDLNDSPILTSTIQSRIESRPRQRATLWLVFLGPFFFLTYGLANNWTAHLPQVSTVVFSWEKHIPFLPWTILPYMSIDAFYAVSLFLCTTRIELDIHAKRLLAATLISVTGFLLFPLQFTFVRPETEGLYGVLFALLTSLDKPFNQAPSLHISLLMLLWVLYARHLRGVARWLMHVWFFLIGISVFTTFQHHFIDGVTGMVVGAVCLYMFPDHPRRWAVERSVDTARHRLATFYFLGGAVFLSFAYVVQGWVWLLLWPSTALTLVSLGYVRYGVNIFQKCDGRLSWPARMLVAPYQAGAWLSSRWFTRNEVPSAEVASRIWIGRIPGKHDWRHLNAGAVLDLTAEFDASRDALKRRYVNVPMLDLLVPSRDQLQTAVVALDTLKPHGPVLVHCALGYSRSALVVAAWLLQCGFSLTVEEAVEKVRLARPKIVLPPSYLEALEEFCRANAIQQR